MDWIDINKELPPLGTEVLIYDSELMEINISVFRPTNENPKEFFHYNCSNEYKYNQVTHWCFLTKPNSKESNCTNENSKG